MRRLVLLCLVILMGVAGLPSQAAPPPQADNQPLYVAFVWHQHQPVYFKDPQTGVYQRPWVRMHAAKSYLDMVTILQDYPEIHATYNLTPSLMLQLDDFLNGAKDQYWVTAEIPADQLTETDKRYLLSRFFDINARIIARFPRYQELADLRVGGSEEQIEAALQVWTTQDYLDLQVLFNLAWTDPDFLAVEPLASLVAKGRDFTEADKPLIFAEHLRIISEIIPTHKAMQEAGQIEVTTTPLAHPILPLLVDSDLAFSAMPDSALPPRFVFGQDAVAQVNLGVEMYTEKFGIAPRGMWPAEGSVAPDILQMIYNAGIQWIATDEAILAKSLPELDDFTRNSEDTVQQADALYRPYTVRGLRGGEVSILFRDHIISDKVGFEYSALSGQAAADDLIQRLNNIQAQLAEEGATGPNLVTILLDGENAWEHYENDGKEFFHALYQGLSEADNLQTVTPSEYLALTEAPRPLENLWAGSWITPDFSTWIGEEEENLGWTYLLRMREDVQRLSSRLDPAVLDQVMQLVYFAEGSDWYWWYGSDQNSGVDRNFDAQFRGFLEQIYTLMGEPVPDYVYVPIIAQGVQPPDREAANTLAITTDGIAADGEWDNAAFYAVAEGGLTGFYYGFDNENLYLRLDSTEASFPNDAVYEFYLRIPDNSEANAYPRATRDELIGFGARRMIAVHPFGEQTVYVADGQGGWEMQKTTLIDPPTTTNILEVKIPLTDLSPTARSGDTWDMRLAVNAGETLTAFVPSAGSAVAILPDQAIPNVFLEVADPENDDFGLGSYTYPLNAVFRGGAYDATNLVVGYDDQEIIFQISLRGPLVNDWGSGNGMGILTADIYIDTDGAETGNRLLLGGRNLALNADFAWDYAIFAEGWNSAIYTPAPDGGAATLTQTGFTITTNPTQKRVTVRIPRTLIAGDPTTWAYTVLLAGQDGFPAAGVLRIRDILPEAEEWRFGGGTGHLNATRVLDVILPPAIAAEQAALLSAYTPAEGSLDDLTPDDFAQIPMIRAE